MSSRFMPLVIAAATIVLGGCATIIHNGPRKIPVASTPPGATVSVYDRTNTMISEQTTPFVATLPVKFGYFKGQSYRLVFGMPGYQPAEVNLRSSVSGWYFGNILFGGLIGMLIVDPLTGAMYNLKPQKIEQSMTPAQARLIEDGDALMVALIAQATAAERAAMVPIN